MFLDLVDAMKTIQVLLLLIAFLIDGLFFSLHGERIQIGYYVSIGGVKQHLTEWEYTYHISIYSIYVFLHVTFVYKCIGRQSYHTWCIWATGLGDERKVRDVFL